MKKFGYVIAALATIAIAAPSIASAETGAIRGDRGNFGARAEMHRDRGMHRDHGWRPHHERMVVVRHRHHDR